MSSERVTWWKLTWVVGIVYSTDEAKIDAMKKELMDPEANGTGYKFHSYKSAAQLPIGVSPPVGMW